MEHRFVIRQKVDRILTLGKGEIRIFQDRELPIVLPDLVSSPQFRPNLVGYPLRFQMRRRNNQGAFTLRHRSHIVLRQNLVTLRLIDLLDPAQFVELTKRLSCAAFTQSFNNLLIVSFLPLNVPDFCRHNPCAFFQQTQCRSAVNGAVLAAIAG